MKIKNKKENEEVVITIDERDFILKLKLFLYYLILYKNC